MEAAKIAATRGEKREWRGIVTNPTNAQRLPQRAIPVLNKRFAHCCALLYRTFKMAERLAHSRSSFTEAFVVGSGFKEYFAAI